MSETKWTPGPWRVGLNGSPSVRSVWTDGGDYHRFVASTECPANAKIISAAPDMAEALAKKPDVSSLNAFMQSDAANKLTEQFPEVGMFLGAYSMWFLQADAALAKAKGEA